ncbi:MAG: hypothetical protein AB7F86_19465 [Bdellovibrionales bacterium]
MNHRIKSGHRLAPNVSLSKLGLAALVLALSACKSNPHKAEKIETKMDHVGKVTGIEHVGVKDGNMVVMSKEDMSEKLRDLQNRVYALEDKVYGTRKLKSLGLYGDLKTCKRKLASKQYGGSGTLVWTEPLDRVTDKEEEFKIGIDEKKELVGVSEEFLKDRLARFQGYQAILQKRSDEFEGQIESCQSELADRKFEKDQSSSVRVQESAKATMDRTAVHDYLCGYVKPGASLKNFMLNAFAKGWISLKEYPMEQDLLPATLQDAKGKKKEHAMLFNGWKLAFSTSPISVTEVLNGDKDATLEAWAYDKKADVQGGATCLSSADGQWNP